MGTSLKGKNLLPEGANSFFLWAVPYSTENYYYHIEWPPFYAAIFITHVRNLRNRCYANGQYNSKNQLTLIIIKGKR